MKLTIDLNCDLGEYESLTDGANDAAIMALISSCNIACGVHAGNQAVIDQTIALALNHQVNVGAHPSYPDRTHFGRKVMKVNAKDLKPIIRDQITAIKSSVEAQNGQLIHVKPHGALYNQAAQDQALSLLLMEAVAEVDEQLLFYGLAHSATALAAIDVGMNFVAEGFIDRAYSVNRTLCARSEPDAIITDQNLMLERTLQMLNEGEITAQSGQRIKLEVNTLCLHGDHENSVSTATYLSAGLINAGILIQAPNQS